MLMCKDKALNAPDLWFVQDDFPHGAHHREIAISISNYTLKHGDAGLIIVGGRMEMHHQVYHFVLSRMPDRVMNVDDSFRLLYLKIKSRTYS